MTSADVGAGIRMFAPAKVNLTLKVGRPRADGLHPITSVVAFANVGDWIEARDSDAISLSVRGPFAPALAGETDNLVIRAAGALREAAGVKAGAALVLEKNLPVASGIGGGSSDAAAALKALNALWRLEMPEVELAAIGRSLGADVPVCLAGRAAFVTGAGEMVSTMSLPRLHAVLVNALAPVATGEVYRVFDEMGLGAAFRESEAPFWLDASAAIEGAARLGNDLLEPACRVSPVIVDVIHALSQHAEAKHVALSGSGGTVFALTETGGAARALASKLAARDGWARAAVLE